VIFAYGADKEIFSTGNSSEIDDSLFKDVEFSKSKFGLHVQEWCNLRSCYVPRFRPVQRPFAVVRQSEIRTHTPFLHVYSLAKVDVYVANFNFFHLLDIMLSPSPSPADSIGSTVESFVAIDDTHEDNNVEVPTPTTTLTAASVVVDEATITDNTNVPNTATDTISTTPTVVSVADVDTKDRDTTATTLSGTTTITSAGAPVMTGITSTTLAPKQVARFAFGAVGSGGAVTELSTDMPKLDKENPATLLAKDDMSKKAGPDDPTETMIELRSRLEKDKLLETSLFNLKRDAGELKDRLRDALTEINADADPTALKNQFDAKCKELKAFQDAVAENKCRIGQLRTFLNASLGSIGEGPQDYDNNIVGNADIRYAVNTAMKPSQQSASTVPPPPPTQSSPKAPPTQQHKRASYDRNADTTMLQTLAVARGETEHEREVRELTVAQAEFKTYIDAQHEKSAVCRYEGSIPEDAMLDWGSHFWTAVNPGIDAEESHPNNYDDFLRVNPAALGHCLSMYALNIEQRKASSSSAAPPSKGAKSAPAADPRSTYVSPSGMGPIPHQPSTHRRAHQNLKGRVTKWMPKPISTNKNPVACMFIDCWDLRTLGDPKGGRNGHTKHFIYAHTDQVLDKENLGRYGKDCEVLVEEVIPQNGLNASYAAEYLGFKISLQKPAPTDQQAQYEHSDAYGGRAAEDDNAGPVPYHARRNVAPAGRRHESPAPRAKGRRDAVNPEFSGGFSEGPRSPPVLRDRTMRIYEQAWFKGKNYGKGVAANVSDDEPDNYKGYKGYDEAWFKGKNHGKGVAATANVSDDESDNGYKGYKDRYDKQAAFDKAKDRYFDKKGFRTKEAQKRPRSPAGSDYARSHTDSDAGYYGKGPAPRKGLSRKQGPVDYHVEDSD